MKIKEIEIENYRNFKKKISIKFNDEINFIIGENNLGKSNLLKLLNKIFNARSIIMFYEEDFYDIKKEILVNLKLKLDSDDNLGIFEDNFSPDSNEDFVIIDLRITQIYDEEVNITCLNTNSEIRRSDLKNLNFFYIDSTENQNNHLDFNKKYDVDGSLGRLFEKCIEQCNKENLIEELKKIKDFEKLKDLLDKINNHFSKLYVSEKHNVSIDFNNFDNLLCNMFFVKEGNGINLKMSGQGLKSLLYLELAILYKLFKINKESRMSLSNFESIIAIDEPEAHLHNYKQRCFIQYLLKNFKFDELSKGNRFKELVKDLFNINSLDRQIIVVTHSPDILLEDYKQIIRFYNENKELKVISGENVEISDDDQELKHYFQHIKEFKEAFFSRGIIICEGDTEIGFLKSFFNKKNINTDELGISILPTGSCDNMKKIKELCNKFGITAIGIRDRDLLTEQQIDEFKLKDIYCTNKKNAEEEFMQVLDKNSFYEKAKENGIFLEQINQIEQGVITEISNEHIINTLNGHKNRVFRFKCAECLKTIPACFDELIDKIILRIKENEPDTREDY